MADIPEDIVTAADIADWYKTKEELGKLKAKEALLRSRIFKFYFTAPVEGVNEVELKDGTGAVMKGTYKINRSVDIGSLDALRTALANPGDNGAKLKLDDLIKWKPEVSITEYRKLTAEERNRFDTCLVIKPGSPELDVVIPKKPKL